MPKPNIEEIKEFTAKWWDRFSDQEAFDNRQERGPNLVDMLTENYGTTDLSGLDLSELDFRCANLAGVNLKIPFLIKPILKMLICLILI